MKVKNTSSTAQHFPNIGTFEAGETKEVSDDTGAFLCRSPFIEKVGGDKPAKFQGKTTEHSVRGVEKE